MEERVECSHWLAGDSEAARRLRATEAPVALLGPLRSWPPALRIMLATVLEAGVPMALAWGPRLVLLYNDEAIPLLATRHPGAFGRPLAEVWPLAWPQLQSDLYRVLQHGERVRFRDRTFLSSPLGSEGERCFSGCFSPVRDEGGRVRGVLLQAVETSAEAKAARALRRSEDFLHLAVEAGGVGTWVLNMETKECLVSPTMCQLMGFPAGTQVVSEKVWQETITPEYREMVRVAIAASLQRGVPLELEFRVRRSDDEERWLVSRGRIAPDSADRPRYLHGAALDITERKHWEQRLRDSEAQFRALFEVSNVGMAEADPQEGRLLRVNAQLARMLGYVRADLLGRTLLELMHPMDQKANQRFMEELVRGERSNIDLEERLLRQDGSALWVMVSVNLIRRDDATPVRIFVVVRDIHMRKMAEEALRQARNELEHRVHERTAALAQANAMLQEEVAERRSAEQQVRTLLRQLIQVEEGERRRISRELHDSLGQHLTLLSLGLKAASEQDSCPMSVRHRLSQAQEAAKALEASVDRLAHEMRPPALDDLGLEEALRLHAEAWSAESGIPVEFHSHGLRTQRMSPEVETTVYRVIQEALTNVRRHAGAGRVALLVERRGQDLRAIVEDDGQGFDTEAPPRRSGRHRLGLRGMQERAALNGGQLEVESTPGFGTTIYLKVPLSAPPNAEGMA